MWVWEHGLDWSGSQQGQVVGFCESGNEPSSSIICRKLLEWLSLSKRTLLHGISCLVTCLVAAQNICKIQWSWTVQTVKLHCANSTALWTEFVQIMQTHFTKWIICSRCLRGGTVRWSNPGGGEIFRTCQNRPWDPPSLLHNRYRGFPGGKKKSKAIPLLPLRTFMACYGGTFTLSNWFILPTFPKSPMIRLIASNDSKIDKRWAEQVVSEPSWHTRCHYPDTYVQKPEETWKTARIAGIQWRLLNAECIIEVPTATFRQNISCVTKRWLCQCNHPAQQSGDCVNVQQNGDCVSVITLHNKVVIVSM